MADLAGHLQGIEGLDCFRQRHAARPMQQIEIDAVGGEPFQAVLAGPFHAGPRSIGRQHLGNQKGLVAAPGDGFRHHLLGAAAGIHLRRIDERDAEVQPEPQRRDLVGAAPAVLTHLPGALTQHRNGFAGR